MRAQFNTQRQYTDKGQIIVMKWNEDTELATFHDVSRMISGSVSVANIPGCNTITSIFRSVMHAYDHCYYENIGTWEAPKFDASEVIVSFPL